MSEVRDSVRQPEADQPPASVILRDDFARPVARGQAIGSSVGDVHRLGVDRESVIGVDHGALRIGTLVTSSWGNATLSYGPIDSRPGRASCITLTNGHNTSESYVLGSVARRVARWAIGSETEGLGRRALRYPRSKPREPLARKVRYWWANRGGDDPEQKENLFVGWFTSEQPSGPTDGTGVVVRATGPFNGELTVTTGAGLLPLFRGLQNLPVHYVTIRRETGHIHYATSPYAAARGLPTEPWLRPLAIDERSLPSPLYLGLSQACSGQIGFSCDTRVHEARVVDVPAFATWRTTAFFADRFDGPVGPLTQREAEIGGAWTASGAGMAVDDRGLGLAATVSGRVELTAPADDEVGLVHVVVEGLVSGDEVALLWRHHDNANQCCVTITPDRCSIRGLRDGRMVARADTDLQLDAGVHHIQLSDDGNDAVVAVDGAAVARSDLREGPSDAGLGLRVGGSGSARLRDFEAHARRIRAPENLLPVVETVPLGDDEPWFVENFALVADDLDGMAAGPAGRWQRRRGPGRLYVPTPGTARFDASVDRPVAARTAYLLDWPDPDHCDIELLAVAPVDSGRPGRRGRVGLQLWQDDDTSMIANIWLDEAYPSASASTFFTFRGFEDIYDAVWSNLGDLVDWENPFRLRLVSDGVRFVVLINDEPVLQRAFSDVHPSTDRLTIRRAGIVANWEWGHDTGSLMHRFVARRRLVRPAGDNDDSDGGGGGGR
jgi:hypothetical protein